MNKRKTFIIITFLGLIFTLFGFTIAFWSIAKYQPILENYIFTISGLVASLYGLGCAFRSIKRNQPVLIGNKITTVLIMIIGLEASICRFTQAY